MNSFPKLKLPPVKLRANRRDGCDYIWDSMRGCWLLLTPEEWVRRHVIAWLTDGMGVASVNIIQEYPIDLGGAIQRADIVIYDSRQKPVMLVECKAAEVAIDSSVLDQAVRYNSVVGAKYLMLTNGITHYFYAAKDGRDYVRLDTIPELV